jgi:polyferredoxin
VEKVRSIMDKTKALLWIIFILLVVGGILSMMYGWVINISNMSVVSDVINSTTLRLVSIFAFLAVLVGIAIVTKK